MRSLLSAMHKLSNLYPNVQFNKVGTCAAYVSMKPPISVKTMIDEINIMPVAFVLSGGGAKGDFQVGALKYLYHRGIRPNIICGTSIGAINGVTIAQGEGGLDKLVANWLILRNEDSMYKKEPWLETLEPKVQELLQTTAANIVNGIVGGMVKYALFPPLVISDAINLGIELPKLIDAVDKATHAKFLYNLEPLTDKLKDKNNLDPENVRQSGIKLRLAVVSLESGTLQYVTESGELLPPGQVVGSGQPVDLVDAVLASAAIPVFFPPVKLGNENYVDGGVREILPIQAAVDLGANQIYAIACSKTGANPSPSFDDKNLLDIALRAAGDIMPDETMRNETNPPRGWGVDVKLIQPTFEVHDTMTIDPGLIRIAIAYGYMRAYDTIEGGSNPQQFENLKRTSDRITQLRFTIWKTEEERPDLQIFRLIDFISNYLKKYHELPEKQTDTLINIVNDMRHTKKQLKTLVERRQSESSKDSVPDDVETWWNEFEQHKWTSVYSLWAELKVDHYIIISKETP